MYKQDWNNRKLLHISQLLAECNLIKLSLHINFIFHRNWSHVSSVAAQLAEVKSGKWMLAVGCSWKSSSPFPTCLEVFVDCCWYTTHTTHK